MPDTLTRTFAALADPTRRAMLADLTSGVLTVNDLVDRHHLSQPAISKHLKVLEAAGLISRGKVAQTRPCILNPEGLKTAAAWVDAYRHHWDAAFDRIDSILATLTPPEKPNA
jgi:DNA-binding transcriptional ArsR family regulator